MNKLFNMKILDNGIKKNYEILYLFENNDNKYLVYTDNEENNLNILASKYEIIDNEINLIKIESEEEFDFIDKMIGRIEDRYEIEIDA